MSSLAPFAAVDALINQGMQAMLADRIATWAGGPEFGVLMDVTAADIYDDAITAARTTISLCVANTPGIAEGATDLRIGGQPCRVTSEVVPDAAGWATFAIVMEAP